MSFDPTFNPASIKIKGDISSGFGQLGLTTRTVGTSVGSVSQVPGAIYSDYYSHYVFTIDAGGGTDFVLAPIGVGGVSVGYTACIDCLTTGSANPADSLTIRNSLNVIIGRLWSGSKAFVIAVSAPATWKFAYAVPEGSNNKLLVYNGPYPQVNLLPIQKEISVNGSNQYGIKCIQSWDPTDPTNLPPGSVTVTNANKIVVMAGDRVTCSTLNVLTDPTSTATLVGCQQFTFSPAAGSNFVAGAIACYSGGSGTGFVNLGAGSVGLFMGGTQGCNIVQTVGGGSIAANTGVLWSDNCDIDCTAAGIVMRQNGILTSTSATISGQSDGSTVIGTNQCSISTADFASIVSSSTSTIGGTNSGIVSVLASSEITSNDNRQSAYVASFRSAVTADIQNALVASDKITITGDGNYNFDNSVGGIGYINNRAGISVISSHDIASIASAADLRYCVIGGYNGVTWSIDSKTGIHYGSNFNNTQPLPGFAEMFENATAGIIPHGRLLQLENGKVRLAQNGESGFMISRPYESAAFVAGNPYHDWHKKYLTDQFGCVLTETISRDDYEAKLLSEGISQDEVSKIISSLPESGVVVKKLNPDHSADKSYVPRSERPDQWTTCEKSGMVAVEYSGDISIGDFLISGQDGVAKRSSRKSNIRVLELLDAVNSNASNKFAKVDLANQHIPDYIEERVSITSASNNTAIASSLPVDISIKDIVFANDSISIESQRRIKVSITLVGDILLSTDISIALVGSNNVYDLGVSYAKVKSSYVINGMFRGIIQPDTYKLVFTTSKSLPAECKLSIKI